jgi:hypothetical protein
MKYTFLAVGRDFEHDTGILLSTSGRGAEQVSSAVANDACPRLLPVKTVLFGAERVKRS